MRAQATRERCYTRGHAIVSARDYAAWEALRTHVSQYSCSVLGAGSRT